MPSTKESDLEKHLNFFGDLCFINKHKKRHLMQSCMRWMDPGVEDNRFTSCPAASKNISQQFNMLPKVKVWNLY